MPEETKLRERRNKIEMKNNLEEVNFLEKKAIRERGITLIALVVTIIVLLILASISISVILGDNGLIEMAKEAGRKTNEAVEKEQGDIANLTNDLKDFIDGEKTLVQMFRDGELQVGDYINYENPKTGSWTVSTDKTGAYEDQTFSVENNDLHWRILGIDEKTGGLKLISGRPIKSNDVNTEYKDPYFSMNGTYAYEYGITELNNIAKIFMNEKYAQDVRSVTIEDIDEAVGIKKEEDIKRVNLNYYRYSYLEGMQYGESYSFKNVYTPKTWLEEQEEIKTNPEAKESKMGSISGTVDAYYYSINSKDEPTVEVENETLFNMLFGNTEGPTTNEGGWCGAKYWLASRGVDGRTKDGSQFAFFGLFSVRSRYR